MIAKRPRKEHEGPKGPRPVHIPLSAMKDIERSLGYFEYPKRSRVIDTTRDEHPYYASLGATDDLTNDHMEWAYDRQCKCDPFNKPYYLDCIADIANGRGDGAVDLQMKVAMAISAGEVGLNKIEEAYKFFGLAYNTKEGDDHVMGLYKSRIESAPRQKDEARECLHVIAKHRNSEKIEALANDKALTFDEALEFLHITANTDSDSIEAAAIALVSCTFLMDSLLFLWPYVQCQNLLLYSPSIKTKERLHEPCVRLPIGGLVTSLFSGPLLPWNLATVIMLLALAMHTNVSRSNPKPSWTRQSMRTMRI